MSEATSARNVGAAATPIAGPANTSPEFCTDSAKDNAGVEAGFATDVVKSGLRFPALKLVTLPTPLTGTYAEMLPFTSNCHTTFRSPPGAAGVVLLKLGAVTREPFMLRSEEHTSELQS